jgi:hypothetical protein
MGLSVIHEVHIKSNMHYLPNALNFDSMYQLPSYFPSLPLGFGEFYDEKRLNFLITYI